jgi:UDP-glucose 4-epimerase
MKIAVTGATGFIGKALCPYLEEKLGARVIPLNRSDFSASDTPLTAVLNGVNCLIHLAARAHTQNSTATDFESDNQKLCQRIATLALATGIPRVIYLSSIKVNGESTSNRAPFSAEDFPAPLDDYGRSKLASEKILQDMLKGSSTRLVIIRPPLVYGSHNKGNLAALEAMINRGVPLPFAAIHNKRDLVSINNLCSLISLCCTHPDAADQVFLASDDIPRSTADIVRLLAQGAQTKARLFPLPSVFFNLLGLITPAAIARLTGDLQVDISKTKCLLGWSPNQS